MLEIVVIQCPPIRIENANRICKQISHFNVNVILKWSNFDKNLFQQYYELMNKTNNQIN